MKRTIRAYENLLSCQRALDAAVQTEFPAGALFTITIGRSTFTARVMEYAYGRIKIQNTDTLTIRWIHVSDHLRTIKDLRVPIARTA